MISISARLTLELISITVFIVSEPTLSTPFRRVPWRYRLDEYVLGFCLVLDVGFQRPKRPVRVPIGVGKSCSDLLEILEYDTITVVFQCFLDDTVRDSVEYMTDIPALASTSILESPMSRLGTRLLETATCVLEFATNVVEFTRAKKAGSAGDRDLIDAEVNTKNRSVRGR